MKDQIKYRFPAKGDALDRRYVPMRVQSVEQMEEDVGIDAELTMLRRKINDKYKPFLTKELSVKQDTGPKKYQVEKRGLEKTIIIER